MNVIIPTTPREKPDMGLGVIPSAGEGGHGLGVALLNESDILIAKVSGYSIKK